MLHHLLSGLADLASPGVAELMIVGVLIGVFMGVLPGLGVAMVLSIMLAFVYEMKVDQAVALMLATQAGSYFSASITAILLNSPGAPESMPVTFDGFQMARRGRAGEALGVSATSTLIGGLIGAAALLGFLQIVNYLPSLFHPPEYVALIVLAVILTGTLGTNSISKALLSAGVGLMISFIGNNPVTGDYRFTFGNPELYGGISVVALALGMFAIPQMVFMYGSDRSVSESASQAFSDGFRRQVLEGIAGTFRHWFLLVRSALLGVVCGVIPGIGGFTANFLSYGVAQQTAKRRALFGTGIPEGIIAPEGSSLAKEAGSLVPAIGLGLPSGLGMVLFLAALSILGLQPGPGFLHNHQDLAYMMMWTIAIAGIIGTVAGLLAVPLLARVTRVRGPLLLPFVVALAVVGSYASDVSMATVVELMVMSLAGIALRRLRYSLAALAVGLVLGAQLEDQAYLTRQIFGWHFIARPFTDVLFALAGAVVVAQYVRFRRGAGRATVDGPDESRGDYVRLDLFVAIVLTVLAALYLTIASGYSMTDKLMPMIAGVVVAVVGALRVVMILVKTRRGGPTRLAVATATAGAVVHATASSGEGGGDSVSRMGAGSTPAAERGMVGLDAAPPPASGMRGGSGLALEDRPPQAWPERLRRHVQRARGHVTAREAMAMCWVIAIAVSAYLIGFIIGVPLVVFLYGLFGVRYASTRNRTIFTAAATAVAWGLTFGIFTLLNLSYPGVLGI